MRRGSQTSPPFDFCFFCSTHVTVFLLFFKRACCEGEGYREREGGKIGGMGDGLELSLRVCVSSFSVWCFVQL